MARRKNVRTGDRSSLPSPAGWQQLEHNAVKICASASITTSLSTPEKAAAVDWPLMSESKLTRAGHRGRFGQDLGTITLGTTGRVTEFFMKDGVHVLKMWVLCLTEKLSGRQQAVSSKARVRTLQRERGGSEAQVPEKHRRTKVGCQRTSPTRQCCRM